MKTLIIIFPAILIVMGCVNAQEIVKNPHQSKNVVMSKNGTKPKGPEAKNYKAWEDKDRTKHRVVTTIQGERPKGPKAKNRRSSRGSKKTTYGQLKSKNPKMGLKGPKAKNYHPRRMNKR